MTHQPDIPADPVVTMAGILALVDTVHSEIDERGIAARHAKSEDGPYLDRSLHTLGGAIEAIRDAMSYLPATTPAGAVIQIALAGIAADLAREGSAKAMMRRDAARAVRHIEAALPVFTASFGVNLAALRMNAAGFLLPDVLRKAYVADLATLSVVPPAEEERP